MSQAASYAKAYEGSALILKQPYAHGDNGTASLYSSKGGRRLRKRGASKRRSKGGRPITQKRIRRSCQSECRKLSRKYKNSDCSVCIRECIHGANAKHNV